jgi:hypothetical protein
VVGYSWFSLVGGTPGLATFLDWFYSNQTRYVFRSAYLVNVFDKLFGYQYHLSAILPKRLSVQALLVLFLHFCLLFGVIKLLPLSLRGFNGVNSSQIKRYTIGIALEKGLGSDRMNGTCVVEMSELPKPCGAEGYAINESGM